MILMMIFHIGWQVVCVFLSLYLLLLCTFLVRVVLFFVMMSFLSGTCHHSFVNLYSHEVSFYIDSHFFGLDSSRWAAREKVVPYRVSS